MDNGDGAGCQGDHLLSEPSSRPTKRPCPSAAEDDQVDMSVACQGVDFFSSVASRDLDRDPLRALLGCSLANASMAAVRGLQGQCGWRLVDLFGPRVGLKTRIGAPGIAQDRQKYQLRIEFAGEPGGEIQPDRNIDSLRGTICTRVRQSH
jgi:hypothetical protein